MTRLWWALLAVLAISPIAYGAFRPLAWSLTGLAVAAIALLWLGMLLTRPIPLFWRGWLWPPAIVFVFLLIWIGVQNWAPVAAANVHPVWQIAGDALGQRLHGRIGTDPEAASVAVLRLLTSAMIFWLALQFGRDGRRARLLIQCLALVGGLQALYGILNLLAGNQYLLWYPRTAYFDDVTGTFVNRNSFATFAGIGLLACVTLVVESLRRGLRVADPSLNWVGRRIEALSGWPTVYLVSGVLLAMAVAQSHSRMGLVSTLAGLAALLLLLRMTRQVRGWWPLVAGGLGVALTIASVSSGTLERAVRDGTDRSQVMALTVDAIQSAPLLGSGYGSFASTFPMYRDSTLPGPVVYTMAHNTYLELAMDLGVPAAVLAVLALAWLVAIVLIGLFRRDRDRSVPTLAVAAAVLVAVHSLADFSLQISAVQYWFAALLGIGVAQAFPTAQARPPSDEADASL